MSSPEAKAAESFLLAVARSAVSGILAILSGGSEQDAYDTTIEKLASEKARAKWANLREEG